jgi:hypothetical protein
VPIHPRNTTRSSSWHNGSDPLWQIHMLKLNHERWLNTILWFGEMIHSIGKKKCSLKFYSEVFQLSSTHWSKFSTSKTYPKVFKWTQSLFPSGLGQQNEMSQSKEWYLTNSLTHQKHLEHHKASWNTVSRSTSIGWGISTRLLHLLISFKLFSCFFHIYWLCPYGRDYTLL